MRCNLINWQQGSPCELLAASVFGMPVWIKRDDLLHPFIAGNKFRKLKFPLMAVAEQYAARLMAPDIVSLQPGFCASSPASISVPLSSSVPLPRLVTMGGLWSNHLHATAYAAALCGYASVGLVRGHPGMHSATLDDCRTQGMQVRFVDRVAYRRLREEPDGWRELVAATDEVTDAVINGISAAADVWLPEGGSAPAALHGVAQLIDELPFIPDVLLVACGTAATLAGLLAGLQGRGRVIGIAVLKNADYLRQEVARLLLQAGYPAFDNFQLLTEFHHGGYARSTPLLRRFCAEFTAQSGVPVEPVYTGKVAYALRELIRRGCFSADERVMMLHTGGLQGLRGIPDGK